MTGNCDFLTQEHADVVEHEFETRAGFGCIFHSSHSSQGVNPFSLFNDEQIRTLKQLILDTHWELTSSAYKMSVIEDLQEELKKELETRKPNPFRELSDFNIEILQTAIANFRANYPLVDSRADCEEADKIMLLLRKEINSRRSDE